MGNYATVFRTRLFVRSYLFPSSGTTNQYNDWCTCLY